MRIGYLIVLILVSVAAAQVPSEKKTYPEEKCCCSTVDTNICLGKILPKAEAELNETYQKALKKNFTPREKLRTAERAWIVYRKTNCDAEAAKYEGGSIQPQIQGFCVLRITRQRIEELRLTYLSER